jgi:hypothetical protein
LPRGDGSLGLGKTHAHAPPREGLHLTGLIALAVADLRRTPQGEFRGRANPVERLRNKFIVEEGRVLVALGYEEHVPCKVLLHYIPGGAVAIATPPNA